MICVLILIFYLSLFIFVAFFFIRSWGYSSKDSMTRLCNYNTVTIDMPIVKKLQPACAWAGYLEISSSQIAVERDGPRTHQPEQYAVFPVLCCLSLLVLCSWYCLCIVSRLSSRQKNMKQQQLQKHCYQTLPLLVFFWPDLTRFLTRLWGRKNDRKRTVHFYQASKQKQSTQKKLDNTQTSELTNTKKQNNKTKRVLSSSLHFWGRAYKHKKTNETRKTLQTKTASEWDGRRSWQRRSRNAGYYR